MQHLCKINTESITISKFGEKQMQKRHEIDPNQQNQYTIIAKSSISQFIVNALFNMANSFQQIL